jgi:hypothetical protein
VLVTRLSRLLKPFRRPAHIAPWGGDLTDPFITLWEPNPRGQIR